MYDQDQLDSLVSTFKADPASVYNTWFINDERLKAFRSIRRGVAQVVDDIHGGTFPSDFKGSSLEFVLKAITEQKQVFQGAAHAFYWKPKLRIPDIYEDETNQRRFGQFLESCCDASTETQLFREIDRLDAFAIKGLGPAVANILYFLHPTVLPPSNTAILRGFNLLFGEKKKLGSWTAYLEMRSAIIEANKATKGLSKDLGAFAGLLFDIGMGKLVVDEDQMQVDQSARKRRERTLKERRKTAERDRSETNQHTRMQHMLLRIGRELGYDTYVASNDHSRSHAGEKLSFLSLRELPPLPVSAEVLRTIGLIDVVWLEKGGDQIVCAFEVEHSTSIYSGILRLTDLVTALPSVAGTDLYLVVPDDREREVIAQLQRPSIAAVTTGRVSYILCSALDSHCDSICMLGEDRTIMAKVACCVCAKPLG